MPQVTTAFTPDFVTTIRRHWTPRLIASRFRHARLRPRRRWLAVDAGVSCSELSALNVSDLGRNRSVLVARGGPRERIARLSLEAHIDLSLYLELRRDLFGFGSEALFVSTRGARERLPLRSIAQAIQLQIENASLEERMILDGEHAGWLV
jgi:hypothetical protein